MGTAGNCLGALLDQHIVVADARELLLLWEFDLNGALIHAQDRDRAELIPWAWSSVTAALKILLQLLTEARQCVHRGACQLLLLRMTLIIGQRLRRAASMIELL